MDRLNVSREKPRHVLQVDQILPMAKHDDTVKMAEEIMGRCKNMHIKPEWVAVDKMQPVSEPVLTPYGWKRIGDKLGRAFRFRLLFDELDGLNPHLILKVI